MSKIFGESKQQIGVILGVWVRFFMLFHTIYRHGNIKTNTKIYEDAPGNHEQENRLSLLAGEKY